MSLRKRMVRCKCPKCGATHKLNIEWTGTGTCRKYCNNCKNGVTVADEAEYYRVMVEDY